MSVFPVIFDSTPDYVAAADAATSLAGLPCGGSTVGEFLSTRLREATRRKALLLLPEGNTDAGLTSLGADVESRSTIAEFMAGLSAYEPSDWLLFADPRYLSPTFDPTPLLVGLNEHPRIVRHLVAMELNAGGTHERVEFDGAGRVRRVQRYYDAVTWTVTAGVSCSLVPVSSLMMMMRRPCRIASLNDLRRELSGHASPSRDVPLKGPVFDLSTARGLLRLNESLLLSDASASPQSSTSTQVHATARLVGAVVLHDGAVVEAHATIVGPVVIGRKARISRGSVVAQSVVVADGVVPEGAVVRQEVVGTAARAFAGPGNSDGLDTAGDIRLAEQTPVSRAYPWIKTMLEAVVAILTLVVLSPLLLLIAILIKLESRGPVLFGDPREAKNGRFFRCYKFRTMYVGADAAQRDLMKANQVDGPQFKMERDPRVTPLGRWLRMVSLDELPQFFNVALGQMSLVGPRPSPFRENQTCVPWRDARLSVRPGITGLWQVCRHDRSAGDFHQWIYYDMQYVQHMSFWLDVKILLATIVTFGGKGHVPMSWIISSQSKEHI